MAGTPDNRTPGAGAPETSAQETLTPAIVNGLRDRYLRARGYEGSRQITNVRFDGSFDEYSTTPEGDAWNLVVRTPGAEFSRFDLGIIPIKGGEYASAIQSTTKPSEGTIAAFAFKGFLDLHYPEPETKEAPDGHTAIELRSQTIMEADRSRAEGPHLSPGRDVREIRLGVSNEDTRTGADSHRGTRYSPDAPEDPSQ
jgi:hypothetical protein